MIRRDVTIKDLDRIAVSDYENFKPVLINFLEEGYKLFLKELSDDINKSHKTKLIVNDVVLYYILLKRDGSGLDITYNFLYKHDKNYEIFSKLCSKLVNPNNSTCVKKYIINFRINRGDKLDKIKGFVEELLDKNVDLCFMSNKSILLVSSLINVKYIDKIFRYINSIDDIYNFEINDLTRIFIKKNLLDLLLEKGLDVNRLYKYKLNLLSFALFFGDLNFLNKVINLCGLSLIEINETLIQYLSSLKSLNLVKELEIISSLENFDDFINVNFFLLVKISDKETVKYLRRI